MTRDTGPAKLPALPRVNAQDPALRNWISAVTERLEVREGSRGNAMERVVTQRELAALQSKVQILQTPPTPTPGQTLIPIGGGMYAAIDVEAFANSIRNTRLYRDLMQRIDDPDRFNALNQYTRDVLEKSISQEALARGAEIRYTEKVLQTATESLAMTVTEITAALGTTGSGIRTVEEAYATLNATQAAKVTQLESSLGNYYADGAPGRAVLETTLATNASKVAGLTAEYMVKVSAGGAVAGFGLAASEDPTGATESAFIVQADKFAIVIPGDTIVDPLNPPANRIPFGVDVDGVYISGQVRINAQGKGIRLEASSYVYNASTATPSSITLTATLLGGLAGTVSFSATSGVLSGTGNTRTLTTSGIVAPGATVTASVTDAYGTYSESVAIARILNGTTGTAGTDGSDGTRGSVTAYATGSVWSDATANSKITAVTGSSIKVIGDTVTISNGTSFAETKYWSGAAWVSPGVIIDGNLLVNGTVSTAALIAGTIIGFVIKTAASGARIEINNAANKLMAYNADGSSVVEIGGTTGSVYATSQSGAAAIYGNGGALNYGGAFFSGNTSGTVIAANSANGIAINGVVNGGASQPAAHGIRGSNSHAGTSGLVGAANNYDFYADGSGTNYGPFTGAHDMLVANGFAGVLGDIVVDTGVASRSNVSNTIGFVAISTSPSQRGAVGVLASLPKPLDAQAPPAALRAGRTSFYQLDGSRETTDTPVPAFAALALTHKVAAMNSLGEGQINVCGEGGDLLIGDLMVTSSMPGKGMRQADDIIRSYTVAKCRENVTFTSPTEVKMVACIYLCG